MKTLILLLGIFCCRLHFNFTSAQEDGIACVTPTREAGSCIHLDQCKVLFELLKDPGLTQDDRNFLNLSQCGYANNTVSVCCPTDERSDNRRSGVSRHRSNGAPLVVGSCLTPNHEQGSCIEIEQCEVLYNLLQSPALARADSQFLIRSQCGYANRKVLICCLENQRVVQTHQTNTNSSGNPGVVEKQESHTNITSHHFPENSNRRSGVLPAPPICGTFLADRIASGTRVSFDEYPWLALVEYSKPGNVKGFHCGGAMISNRYVLTAAHCTKGRHILPDWRLSGVRLGEFDIKTNPDCEVNAIGRTECAPEHKDIAVENIVAHHLYDPESTNREHDIALLRLAMFVNFTIFIKPICLPSAMNLRRETFTGTTNIIAGWGITERPTASNVKLKAAVHIVDLNECAATYTRIVNISLVPTQICADGNGGVDSCNGDSGGPLMIEMKNIYFISGIVSFGPIHCGSRGLPVVYTRVGGYIDWIMENIRQ